VIVRKRCPPDLTVHNGETLYSGQGKSACPYTVVFGHQNGGPDDA